MPRNRLHRAAPTAPARRWRRPLALLLTAAATASTGVTPAAAGPATPPASTSTSHGTSHIGTTSPDASISAARSAGAVVAGRAAAPAGNPFERGPAPTVAGIEAARGPFAVARRTVARSAAAGFRGGTIYYPTDTTAGTFGAVAISPGYTGPQFTIAWYGARIASQGFVVLTIDTLTLTDQPDSRGAQLLAALDYLTTRSPVADRVDPARLAVMGHSMGGGGSLAAAVARPQLRAVIGLTPYHTVGDWSAVRVPTLVIGAENDSTAPVARYAEPFYATLPGTLDKAYLELAGAGHTAPIRPDTTIAKYSISWLKRFVDDDTRYERFLCPAPTGRAIREYRDTCPHSRPDGPGAATVSGS